MRSLSMASLTTWYVHSLLYTFIRSYFALQWNWSLTTASSPAVDAVYKLARERLPVALEAKLSEFPSALINTHGKDLTVSADPSRSATPAPSTPAASATASTPATASAPVPKPAPKKKAVNTATVTVDASFMASADDLFSMFTDEKRIPSWTRAPAQVRL